MFTGIIETTGVIKAISTNGSNSTFHVVSTLAGELKVDQSLSHDGVCLTVEAISGDTHQVTAIAETLSKTNLGQWKTGSPINLERCMQLNGRLDGHIVQGHVDCTAECIAITDKAGSNEYSFSFPEEFAALVVEKGSISLNGISLTAFNISRNGFTVAIIPYTYEHTNMKNLQMHDHVNIEFDLLGKYVQRMINTGIGKQLL